MAQEPSDQLEEVEECWPLVNREELNQGRAAAAAAAASESSPHVDQIEIAVTISVHPAMATYMLQRCRPSSTLENQSRNSYEVETERRDVLDSIAVNAESRAQRSDLSISRPVQIESENTNVESNDQAARDLPGIQSESQSEHSQNWVATLIKLYEVSAALMFACLPVIMCIAITLCIILFFEYHDE